MSSPSTPLSQFPLQAPPILPPLQSLEIRGESDDNAGNVLQEVLPSLSKELTAAVPDKGTRTTNKIELPSLTSDSIPTSEVVQTSSSSSTTTSSSSIPKSITNSTKLTDQLNQISPSENITSKQNQAELTEKMIPEKLPPISSIQQLPPPPPSAAVTPQTTTITPSSTGKVIMAQTTSGPFLKRDNPTGSDDYVIPQKRPMLAQNANEGTQPSTTIATDTTTTNTIISNASTSNPTITDQPQQQQQKQQHRHHQQRHQRQSKTKHAYCCYTRYIEKHPAQKKLFLTYPFIPYYCKEHFKGVINHLKNEIYKKTMPLNPKPGMKDPCCCLCAGLYNSSSIISCKNPLCPFSFCRSCISKHIHKDSIHEPKLSQLGLASYKS